MRYRTPYKSVLFINGLTAKGGGRGGRNWAEGRTVGKCKKIIANIEIMEHIMLLH